MLDDLQLNPDRLPLYKLILHIAQIVLSFVAWCLAIVVFRAKNATITGQSGWAFAVCFLSLPAWIYLIGAPRFPRTRRFAEPHVMVAIDALYFVLWLSAFAAQAAYNTANKCGNGCGPSKGIVALGVFETIFWGVTTFFSIYSLKYYQFNGHLPGYENTTKSAQNIDPDMAAFSTAPHDEEPYARINNMDPDYDHDQHDYRSETAYGGASVVGSGSGYADAGSHLDTSYGGSGIGLGGSVRHHDNPFDDDHGLRPAASSASLGTSVAHSGYAPPTVHDAFDEDRPVRFPDANYDH